MKTLFRPFSRLGRDRKGATVIEYCIIAGMIALGIIGVVTQIGETTNSSYVAVSDGFDQ
jgi:Flp pilus assembly pilin Flp